MNDLRKVNSIQLYYLWRNFAVSLLILAATIAGTHMLPFYMAPILSLLFCGVLYTMIWNNESSEQPGCMIVMQTTFLSLIAYTFVNIGIVLLEILGLAKVPAELSFLNDPFMPALTLLPISLLMTLYAIFFKQTLPVCRHCIAKHGNIRERGYFGFLTYQESRIQLKNLALMFAFLSGVVWWYYLNAYVNINQNGRDWYIFVWVIIIIAMLDELYFIMRYYNLYLDFEENDEIITPAEIQDMTAKTYLRFYVICGENVYINSNSYDRVSKAEGVFDTPFITQKTVNGIPMPEVRNIVERMTGHKGGELRFYYGRHLSSIKKVSVLRYFYFLDGDVSEYSDINQPGEWVNFEKVKNIYSSMPGKMATNALQDLSRLFTIILTERDFHENGIRKNKIRSYKRTLTLADVRTTKLDLQDDKWIQVAQFNSDMKFFKLKKALRNFMGKSNNHQPSQNKS